MAREILNLQNKKRVTNSPPALFQPDNFSQTEILYKEIKTPHFFSAILEKYFHNAKVKKILEVERKEINSKNYQIIIKENSTEQRLLLRKYQALRDSGHIDFCLRILDELYKKGVKSSRIIKTLKGKLHTQLDDSIYSIFDFIDAHYFIPSKEGLKSAAQEVARLHLAFNQFDGDTIKQIEILSQEGETFFNKIQSCTVEDLIQIENVIMRIENKKDADRNLLKKMSLFKQTAEEIGKRRKNILALPKQIFHSDLHPHNILMQKNKVAAIIDFDSLRVGGQALDVAYAIYRLGKQFFVRHGVGKETHKKARDLTNMFIESYTDIKHLSKNELTLLPFLIKEEMMRKLLFVLRGIYLENNHLWAHEINKFLPAIEEIDYFWPDK